MRGVRIDRAVQTHGGTRRGRQSRKKQRGGRQKGVQRGPVACKPWPVSMPVWLSPAPDCAARPHSPLNLFLTTSPRTLPLCPARVRAARTQRQVPAGPVCVQVEFGASRWSQTGGVGAPGLWCQRLERVGGSQRELLQQVGGLEPPATQGAAMARAPKTSSGGSPASVRRVRGSAPVAGAGPQVAAHEPGAGCWRGASVCILPNAGVRVCSRPANLTLEQPASRRPRVRAGVSGGQRVRAGAPGGTRERGVL